MTFLTPAILAGEDWRGLELAVGRLMSHCGWDNVQDIGQTGDKGADILASRYDQKSAKSKTYLVQVKAVSSGNYVGRGAIQEALKAQDHYRSDVIIVATNGDFLKSAHTRAQELIRQGIDIKLWNGAFLKQLHTQAPELSAHRREPRSYQERIVDRVLSNVQAGSRRSLFIVATGLGKTVIASTATRQLFERGMKKVLVLCHATDLAYQLEREFWTQLPKSVPTRVFLDGEPPVPIEGVNFGLYQTFQGYLGGIDRNAFDIVIVDEAHHALANAFALCINHLEPKHLIGMTATPWRGDGNNIEDIFGPAIDKVSLVDGMKMGFLATVDYRLMCDDVDWDEMQKISQKSLTIRDLNKRLFLPQRDEAVIEKILSTASELKNPKVAIFSPSIEHAKEFASKLSSRGILCENASISDKITRRTILSNFTAGRLQALTAVDVLNEGIDVPDVNIIVFLRATHSRRIFVQQLGRGLRLAPGKEKVIVLDFVTDIRRIAAVIEIDREAKSNQTNSDIERVWLDREIVKFSNTSAQQFVEAWLHDIATLEDAEDSQKLSFPE